MRDKKSIEILERAAKRPDGSRKKVESIFTIKKSTLTSNTKELRKLFEETVSLTVELINHCSISDVRESSCFEPIHSYDYEKTDSCFIDSPLGVC
jgi:hypothetical protein